MPGQLGQIMDKKIEKDKKNLMLVLKSWEQKQGTAHVPCTQHPRGRATTYATPLARPLDPALPSLHLRNQLAPPRGASKGTCCLFLLPLLQPGPQQSLARISCLASDQCLQIEGVKNPGQYQSQQVLFKVPSCLHGLRCRGPFLPAV